MDNDVDFPKHTWFKMNLRCDQVVKLLGGEERKTREQKLHLATCRTVVKFMTKNEEGPWGEYPHRNREYKVYFSRIEELERLTNRVKKPSARSRRRGSRRKKARHLKSPVLSRSLFLKEKKQRNKRQGTLRERWDLLREVHDQ